MISSEEKIQNFHDRYLYSRPALSLISISPTLTALFSSFPLLKTQTMISLL